jgi:asparagine synthetase B (glutamine-hydrolysing)
MGFTAALLSKTGTDVSAQLIKMLRTASNVAGDSYSIANHESVEHLIATESASEHGYDVKLGHKLIMIKPNDPPQPVNQHGYSMTFNGRLWSPQGASDLAEAADILGQVPEDGIGRLIDDYYGSYSITVAEEERILCGRDPVGVIPLYIGESASLLGVASNKRMLHVIGIDSRPLPPGCIAVITKGGVQTRSIRTLSNPQTRKITIEEAVNELDTLLLEAVKVRSYGVHGASLGFSGGIDSSLLAYYLNRCGVNVDLICVGLTGSAFEEAEESAESLDLPIRLESHSLKDVEESLTYVLDTVEDPDPMKIGVALPLAATSSILKSTPNSERE